jgi:hypothetical protein
MIVNAGDTTLVQWEHRDAQTDVLVNPATVTATLTAPDGTVTALTPASATPGIWTVDAHTPTAGDWTLAFTSTGPDERDEIAIHATPPGIAAPWAPTLRTVAAHIPSRTRQIGTEAAPGDNEPAGTFNDTTMPTGVLVAELIDRACAVVAGRMGDPVMPAAYPIAAAAAALWAAYWVELGWPERDADVTVWAQLRADAEAMTVSAVAVNIGAGGGSTGPDKDGTPPVLSTHTFPAPLAHPDPWL